MGYLLTLFQSVFVGVKMYKLLITVLVVIPLIQAQHDGDCVCIDATSVNVRATGKGGFRKGK